MLLNILPCCPVHCPTQTVSTQNVNSVEAENSVLRNPGPGPLALYHSLLVSRGVRGLSVALGVFGPKLLLLSVWLGCLDPQLASSSKGVSFPGFLCIPVVSCTSLV